MTEGFPSHFFIGEITMYSQNDWRNYSELYHHGVLGQRWGKRNGPPYPLDSSISTGKRLRDTSKKSSASENNGIRMRGPVDSLAYTVVTDLARTRSAKKNESTADDGTVNDRTEAALFVADVARHAITMNAIGLALDAKRGAEFVNSVVKTKIYEHERKNEETDKETGFKLKSKEMDYKKDLARVNPNVQNFNANSKSNCMLCTTTYELRRRGYDVTAKTSVSGFMSDSVKDWFPKAQLKTVKGESSDTGIKEKLSKSKQKDATAKLTKELESYGNGARGNLCVVWDKARSGHSMIWEVQNGKLVILDGQVNKVYKDPYKILKQTTGDFQYARTDNVEFDKSAIQRCCKS